MTLTDFSRWLEQEAPWNKDAAIDLGHAFLLFAVAICSKPKDILNLGVGPGVSVNSLVKSVKFNGFGHITAVDNKHDLGGNMSQGVLDDLAKNGVNIIFSPEKEYVYGCQSDSFDLIVSDADHYHAGEWVDEIFRIARPNAFIFVHDANNNDFPGLRCYGERAKELGYPHYLFNKGGRATDRAPKTGWLMIINGKPCAS